MWRQEWFNELKRVQCDILSNQLDEAYVLIHNARRVMLIGNGGSAAIASHIAADLCKAGIPTTTFVDVPVLTMLSNDEGYQYAFECLIAQHIRHDDVLIAISSSGNSENIIRGVASALDQKAKVITLSGFDERNKLRGMGDVNFHVQSHDYGVVEITHLTILHSLVAP